MCRETPDKEMDRRYIETADTVYQPSDCLENTVFQTEEGKVGNIQTMGSWCLSSKNTRSRLSVLESFGCLNKMQLRIITINIFSWQSSSARGKN